MTRRRGYLEKRGENTYRLWVDLGADTATGKRLRRAQTFHGTQKDADKELTKLLSEADKGLLLADPKMSVAAFLERWLEDYALGKSPKTYAFYRDMVQSHIVPGVGNVQLTKLTTSHVVRLVAKLRDAPRRDGKEGTLSSQTVKHVLRVLHVALACAVKWQLIPRNPSDDVDAPSTQRAEMSTFTVEQCHAFLAAAEVEGLKWQAFFTTMMTTGMRLGEAVGLRWQDIELETGTIRVQQSIGAVRGKGIIVKPTKTAGSRRPIAIGSDVVALLRKHRSAQNVTRLQMGPLWADHELAFPNENGSPLGDGTIHATFTRICGRAGVPRIRPYDLRHTAASLLLATGVHPKVVSERLGHSTVNLTLNTYSHVLPTLQQDAANTMDQILRSNPA